jgi:hypothetical protein
MGTELANVPLSRALKIKNRMAQRLAELNGLITAYNSLPLGQVEYDVRVLLRERLELAMRLVELKTTISHVNLPIQKTIFEMAECKALVAMLRGVSTRHGPVVEGYQSVRMDYAAQLRKADIDREVRRVEKEIDRLQDILDRFNYQTSITVEKRLLEDFGAESAPDSAR